MGSCFRFEDGTDSSTVAASTSVLLSGVELFSAINFKLKISSSENNEKISIAYKIRINWKRARIEKSTILLIKLTNVSIKILTEHNSNKR